MGGDRSKNTFNKLGGRIWTTPQIQAPKKGLELLDKLGEAISGSEGTPPASHRWRLGFDTKPLHMEFTMSKAAPGQVFLQIFLFSPVSIIPQVFHIHSYITDCIWTEQLVEI